MAILGGLLLAVGGVVALIASIWLLVVAFQEHILWGLGSIFVPFVVLVFVILHWADAKKPFLYNLLGSVVALVGAALLAIGTSPESVPM